MVPRMLQDTTTCRVIPDMPPTSDQSPTANIESDRVVNGGFILLRFDDLEGELRPWEGR
jgi:hypothetical protein